ncbi:diacylglycerol O-acyltransferase 1 [Tilletia horrida]|nr:diacylglycerol O-acyltransferase 1 [Tilletia horrida]
MAADPAVASSPSPAPVADALASPSILPASATAGDRIDLKLQPAASDQQNGSTTSISSPPPPSSGDPAATLRHRNNQAASPDSSSSSSQNAQDQQQQQQQQQQHRHRHQKSQDGGKFSIQFAPLNVPRHRRLQTMGVLIWALLLPLCLSLYFFLMSVPLAWPFIIPYTLWIFVFDSAAEDGGRRYAWVRNWKLWTYFAEYYPVSLIKTVDLPPDRPYVFGYHPHGVIGMGAFANFATEATEFPTSFPGLRPHLLTLNSNFTIPIYRDLLLALGICSVSKRSCNAILAGHGRADYASQRRFRGGGSRWLRIFGKKQDSSADLNNEPTQAEIEAGKGQVICIVVGGATESLKALPGTADLTLKKRLGFIKIAMRNGADLVPVFSFGENDIFSQLAAGDRVHALQKKFQSAFGFTLPLFHGRGIFNYTIGLMPYRHPIVSVVGRPIHCERNPNPTKAELEEVQRLYITELMNLWETWKDEYAANRTKELTIIE